ncbi:FUSC family protein [Microbacterium sp. W1N]|uniref:FUSC family protein n=1 Tax=Microbacterium festucae TaxID=2977531 RepID=UPI0021BFE08A|nr:FUSC family protein [Microbacterium festucae]MCT9821223.1 FUSC family protein [Microbacterium festucae]
MAETQGRIMTGLIRIAPHRGDHRVALRAAFSLAVPLLVLWALGRLDLSVYASFGAFASLYGRFDPYADRIRMQAAAGVTLLSCMMLGTLVSFAGLPDAARVGIVAVIAAIVTLIAHVWRWHPPGGLFAVFAAGACASLPATAGSFLVVLVVGGASAAFGVAVSTVIALARGGWRIAPPRGTRHPAAATGVVARGVDVALTVAIGAALAGLAGLFLIGNHWYWAMVAAVAALGGAELNARVIRGVQRLLGTVLGIAVAAGLLALHLPPLVTVLVAVLLQAGAELYVSRNYGITMLFVTPLALLMVELAVPADPVVLLRDRMLDTVIGVAVGTLVAVASALLRRRRA